MNDRTKLLLNFNQELQFLIDQQTTALHTQDMSTKALFAIFAIAKASKTHKAILLLAQEGFGEDASILARSLFELMITTLYILQSKNKSPLQRYTDYDWVYRKKLINYIRSDRQLSAQFNEVIDLKVRDYTPEEIDRNYNRVISLYDKEFKRHWSGKDISALAALVGKQFEYCTIYRMQCAYVHSSISSANSYIVANSSITSINTEPDWNVTEQSLLVSFDFLFALLETVMVPLHWNLHEPLKSLCARYKVAMAK